MTSGRSHDEIDEVARGWTEAASGQPSPLLTPAWWRDHVLEWATNDPDFRVKLLQFVDVLPTLRNAAAVADHVRQYFRGTRQPPFQLATGLAARHPFRPVLTKVVREGAFAMARRFIAGATAEEALPHLRQLAEAGIGSTIDLLGEATLSDVEADAYLARYRQLMESLASEADNLIPAGTHWQAIPAINASVKLSALCPHLPPAAPDYVSDAIGARLRPLLLLARAHGAHVQVDMEQFRRKDLIQRAFADAVLEADIAEYPHVGIVVQAYLRDALDDIARLRRLAERRGTSMTIRLVKGAYWDEERIVASQNAWPVPVYERKEETDASFETCVDALMDAWPALQPAFATHNPRSAAYAAIAARERGLRTVDVEFQMLYGMAEGLRNAIAAKGYRTRVYVPIGEIIPGMAYLVRRLLENTSNQTWFMGPFGSVTHAQRSDRKIEDGAQSRFGNVAPAPFFQPETRLPMVSAIEEARRSFGTSYPLLVGGRKDGNRLLCDIRYPADPELLLGQVAQATAADVNEAVSTARDVFPAWRDRTVAERAATLLRAANLMEERRFELAATEIFESAKPWEEADADVAEAVDYLRYYANQAERLGEPQSTGPVPGEENTYLREGRGVAVIIAPWNFPLAIITGMSSAALAAGNCAVLKPAAPSPIVAYKLVEILYAAGVPAEVVQYLPGPGDTVGQALVEHPDVDLIAFTGSKAVGLRILARASEERPGQRNVKRVIAEMGGKNAIVVDEDADLDEAIAGVLVSAFGYAGQKCSAASRLIVVGKAYGEALERLRHAVASLKVGPPHDPATFVPPVINESARAKIVGHIDEGLKTARLFAQGSVPDGLGYYVPPTVFTDVIEDTPLVCEEIFGPVLAVSHAPSFEYALGTVLRSSYALTGGLYSRNPRNIELARREFRVGNLYINRKITGAIVGRQPFGGLRMSGVGEKAGGPDYLRQFMQPRVVTENTMRRGFAPS